jgi:enamine deaminase RidA (YjgF/YER057c/UK114 family)
VKVEIVNPVSLGAPKGFSNGILAPAGGRLLFVAGQIAWDETQRIVSPDFPRQFAQALENVLTVVRAAGGQPEHVVRFTVFVTDKEEYRAAAKTVGVEYRRLMGKHFPAMSLLEVSGLLEPGAKVEIEATAVVPGNES